MIYRNRFTGSSKREFTNFVFNSVLFGLFFGYPNTSNLWLAISATWEGIKRDGFRMLEHAINRLYRTVCGNMSQPGWAYNITSSINSRSRCLIIFVDLKI